ncbi:hypothetical protein [Reinekea blandensis]|uniref:Uncharacterized protein n=1 Tax=Reinekea blandensis MED297 TaxID=314283 RepID=A4BA83_9GAMM|nr:hypothetical protein [Reinekea blandensis]EAR10839.1 hypothetical protein MED297_10026 [Reinekea sp. MED297] [Reinekea blandensis MED297]
MTEQLRDIDLGSATNDPVWLSLNINQLNNTPYLIPVRKETPVLKAEKPDTWPLMLIPVDFCRHTDLRDWCNDGTEPTQRDALRDGWLYLFVDGYLWREVKVLNGHYYDINLQRCFGKSETLRPHSGTRLSSLVIPYRYEGDFIEVKAAFSDTQWSWVTIQKLGGMNPEDPRYKDLPEELSSIAPDNDYIDTRLTLLDFAGEQTDNPMIATQGSLAKELDATVHTYLKYQAQEESIFALPDLIGEALDIKDTYDQILHLATEHNQRIQNSDDPDIKLALDLNLRYNLETTAVEAALHRGHGLVDAETTGFGRARTRNREKLRRKYKIRSLQEELDDRKKKKSRIHFGDIKKALGSEQLQDWVNELYAYREQICDLFKTEAIVTLFQDYAQLGSDEQPFRRVEGLAVLANILDGLSARPIDTLQGCIVDIADARILDQEDEVETLLLGLTEHLNGLDLPGQPTLEPVATQIAQLTVSGLMKSIERKEDGNLLAIAKRYIDELTPEEQQVVANNKLLVESIENDGYVPVEDRHLNAIKTIIRAMSVLTVYQKDQLADYVKNGAELSSEQQQRIAGNLGEKRVTLDNQVREQKTLIEEDKIKVGAIEAELEEKRSLLVQIEANIEQQQSRLTKLEAELKQNQVGSIDLQHQKQRLNQDITVLRSSRIRLEREISFSKRRLQTFNQRVRGHQRTLMQVNDRIAGGQSPFFRGAHFKSNEQLARWTSEKLLGGIIREIEISVDDLVNQRFDSNIVPLDIERLKQRLRKDMQLIDDIVNGAHDTQTTHTLTVGNRKVRLNGQMAADRAEEVIPILQRVLGNADEINQQNDRVVKIMAMDLSTQEADMSQIDQKLNAQDASIRANQDALAELNQQLQAANDSTIPISDTLDSLGQQKRALEASIESLDSKTKTLIRQDMRIHGNLLPVVVGCGFLDLFNFGQKLMAFVKETTTKAMLEFAASSIDIVAFIGETIETTARKIGDFHEWGRTLQKTVSWFAKGFGIAASIITIVVASIELFSAIQKGDVWMGGAQISILIGGVAGFALALGVGIPVLNVVIILASVLIAWIFQEFFSDDLWDRYLEEGPFGADPDKRFSTTGNDSAWWSDDNFYVFSHWQENRLAAWQEWQSLIYRPKAHIDMDGDDISIITRLSSPPGTTLHWKLQMRKNDGQHEWQNLATESRSEPEYVIDTAFAGKFIYGPFKIQAADWRSGFKLELSEDARSFQAILKADLLQRIRDRYWGDDTYDLRLLVKCTPNEKETGLLGALPSPAIGHDGKVIDNWKSNQRRTDQYLHRSGVHDWWYCQKKTIDTEWF